MIAITVDPRKCLGWMESQSRQFPFAVSKALNAVANDAQKAERDKMEQSFRLRRSAWNLNAIKISKETRATKTSWRVIISVDPRASYLNKFEAGGLKVPVGGQKFLWEPNAKVFRNQVIPSGDPRRPKNLNLHRDEHGRVVGQARTFMARTGNPEIPYVIVMRQSREQTFTRGSMRMNLDSYGSKQLKRVKGVKRQGATVTLYKLRTRIPIKAQLHFVETVQATVASRWQARMTEAMEYALRTARR
jgi:hypothetical protein